MTFLRHFEPNKRTLGVGNFFQKIIQVIELLFVFIISFLLNKTLYKDFVEIWPFFVNGQTFLSTCLLWGKYNLKMSPTSCLSLKRLPTFLSSHLPFQSHKSLTNIL